MVSILLSHCLLSVCINALFISFVSVFCQTGHAEANRFFASLGGNQPEASSLILHSLFVCSVYFCSVEDLKSEYISNLTTLTSAILSPMKTPQESLKNSFSNTEEFSHHSWYKVPLIIICPFKGQKYTNTNESLVFRVVFYFA